MTDPSSSPSVPASACVAALRQCGVGHVVTVPDWVQLALHARLEAGEEGFELLNTCNENQAVTVAAGLTLGGKRPVLVMQNQGLYNCVNTLRAICLDSRIPLVLMVGQFGREFDNFGQPATGSRRNMVRLIEPLLDTLGIPFHRLDSEADLPCLEKAYAQATETGGAVVVLVSAPLAWR
ncbi:thiamine pyrophosphate-binding protein [Variovorax robiniae]|uniref:Thiamine pyrophosphate-binding protein n=1 Tax=Variovorax robiniae TaxID=1836199 RepID=A0ABU8X376_9BURK